MRCSRAYKISSHILLVVMSLFFLSLPSAGATVAEAQGFRLTHADIQHETAELNYLDELLTSAVVNFSFTSDPKWIMRYHDYQPKLAESIGTLLIDATAEESEILNHLNDTNRLLANIEEEAIEMARLARKTEALNLVTSVAYRDLKAQYHRLLERYVAMAAFRNDHVDANESSELVVSEEERHFAQSTVIKVGATRWPTLLDVDDDGGANGVTASMLNRISNETGLQFEYVPAEWNELLDKFKAGEIDLLPLAFYRERRKELGHYSSPYFEVENRFFVSKDNLRVRTSSDLAFATVAVPAGYATIDQIRNFFPNINVLETNGLRDSVEMVLTGKADALLWTIVKLVERYCLVSAKARD